MFALINWSSKENKRTKDFLILLKLITKLNYCQIKLRLVYSKIITLIYWKKTVNVRYCDVRAQSEYNNYRPIVLLPLCSKTFKVTPPITQMKALESVDRTIGLVVTFKNQNWFYFSVGRPHKGPGHSIAGLEFRCSGAEEMSAR